MILIFQSLKNKIFLLLVCFVLCSFGALVDGMSSSKVSWWLWHSVNWVRRDVLIFIFLWIVFGKPLGPGAKKWEWFFAICFNFILHEIFYKLGELLCQSKL